MPGPRCDQLARAGVVLGGFHGKDLFPVGPVAVLDAQCDRCADGLAVANAGKNLGSILLDFLAATASVTQLAAVQLGVDELEVDGKLRGKAGKVREKRLSVRFAGGVEFQHPRPYPRVSFDHAIGRKRQSSHSGLPRPASHACGTSARFWQKVVSTR